MLRNRPGWGRAGASLKFLPASCLSPERPCGMSSRGKTSLSLWQKIIPRASPETAAPGCLEPAAVLQRTTFPPFSLFGQKQPSETPSRSWGKAVG